jgi:hypothetical protein
VSATVLVAPREIVDILYRSSRVTGADDAEAFMIARAASFACCQLGANLSHVAEALSRGSSPVLGIGHIAAVEAQARQRGRGEALLEPDGDGVTVADLAHAAFGSCERGIEVTMVCGDQVEYVPHAWLSVGKADLQIVEVRAKEAVMDEGLRQRVETRHQNALRHGVRFPATTRKTLTDVASRHL